jgi:hypothetical protein
MKIKSLCTLSILNLFLIQANSQHWKLGGNNAFPPDAITGVNNILGTTNNIPIRFSTFGQERIHINENKLFDLGYIGFSVPHFAWYSANYTAWGVFGANSAPNGFVGIHTNLPRTKLHIQGDQNCATTVGSGWRPWMRTGVFMNEETNNMYVGMYQRANCLPGNNIPESGPVDAMINWGDRYSDSTV